MSERLKQPLIHQNLADFLSHRSRQHILNNYEYMLSYGCGLATSCDTLFQNGTSKIAVVFYAPLRGAAGQRTILGAVSHTYDTLDIQPPVDRIRFAHDLYQAEFIDLGLGIPQILPEEHTENSQILGKISNIPN